MTEELHPTTLSVGDRCMLEIHDLAFGGEGVGRAGEFVVFVPFVLPGERVEAEITEVKKNFARARLLRIERTSPDRVEPACPHFGACGGCQYQHVRYETQLQAKHKQVADIFRRVGRFQNAPVDPVVPCPFPYGYRNRIMVRSQWNKLERKLVIGFLRHDNRLVVDLDACRIAEPALNEQLKQVRENPPPRGGLKVVLRVAPDGWELPRDSFFQNNFFLLPKLVETVRDRFRDGGSRFLIDAYCGVGFFGIGLADLAERFVGVEIDAPAIKAARKNAAARGIANGEFIAGATDDHLPDLLARFDAAKTTVVLDPPRTGCSPESLDLLRATRPAQIIYVSCHPATLARDLELLCAGDAYEPARVTPLDMFPQTSHVECVADLRRKNAPAAGQSRAAAPDSSPNADDCGSDGTLKDEA